MVTTERTSVLGGESKNRGLISGRRSKGVTAAWAVTGVVGCLLLVFLQFIGLVVTVLVVIGVFVATFDPGTGATPWSRFQDRRRMRYRRRHGLVDFIPVDQRPDDVDRGQRGVEHVPGLAGRRRRPVLVAARTGGAGGGVPRPGR